MTIRTLRRRFAALGTVLGRGVALPFAVGVTPAYAGPSWASRRLTRGTSPGAGRGSSPSR